MNSQGHRLVEASNASLVAGQPSEPYPLELRLTSPAFPSFLLPPGQQGRLEYVTATGLVVPGGYGGYMGSMLVGKTVSIFANTIQVNEHGALQGGESEPDGPESIESPKPFTSYSYQDSLPAKISEDVRERGELGDLFADQKIERDHGKLARGAARAVQKRVNDLTTSGELAEDQKISICIFGDPLALSSRRYMSELDEVTRKRTHLIIADTSMKRLEDIENSDVLEEYSGQVEYMHVESPEKLKFTGAEKPIAIIASDILGTLQSDTLLKRDNGTIEQLRWAQEPSSDTPVLTVDGVTGSALATPIANLSRPQILDNADHRLALSRQLLDPRHFSMLDVSRDDLSTAELHLRRGERSVRQFMDGHRDPDNQEPAKTGVRYNYSLAVERTTKAFVTQIKQGGLVFLADRIRFDFDDVGIDVLHESRGDTVSNLVEGQHVFAGIAQANARLGRLGIARADHTTSSSLYNMIVIDRDQSEDHRLGAHGAIGNIFEAPDLRAPFIDEICHQMSPDPESSGNESVAQSVYEKVEDKYEMFIQDHPEIALDYDLQTDIAQAALDSGEYGIAIKHATLAHEIVPNADVRASLIIANAYTKLERPQDVEVELQHAAKIAPRNPEVWWHVINHTNEQGEWSEYVTAIANYINTAPDLPLYDPEHPNDVRQLVTWMCQAQERQAIEFARDTRPYKTVLVEDLVEEGGMWKDNTEAKRLPINLMERIKTADMADQAFDALQAALNKAGIYGEDEDDALSIIADIRDRAWLLTNMVDPKSQNSAFSARNQWPDQSWPEHPYSRISYNGASTIVSDVDASPEELYDSLLQADAEPASGSSELSIRNLTEAELAEFRAPRRRIREEVTLGAVVNDLDEVEGDFKVPKFILNRHGIIFGQPGSGKTETVFHLLEELPETGVNFIAIDPTGEYRETLPGRLKESDGPVTVIKPNDQDSMPVSIDLFAIPPGYTPRGWAGELYNIFATVFSMEEPLPQLMAEVLERIYEDNGWTLDLRIEDQPEISTSRLVPSFAQMLDVGLKTIGEKGYDREIREKMTGWYTMRVASFQTNEAAVFLEGGNPLDIDELLQRNVIFSLEEIKNDTACSFVKVALVKKLRAHNEAKARTIGASKGLRTVIVLEEAQKELRNSHGQDTPQSKSVDTFCNAIQQDRKWGLGYLIVGQNASDIDNRVISNVAFRVMHQEPGQADLEIMAQTMNMDLASATEFNKNLKQGFAMMYKNDGNMASPLRVQMPQPPEVSDKPVFMAPPPLGKLKAANYGEYGIYTVGELSKAKLIASKTVNMNTPAEEIPEIKQIAWGRLFVYALGQAFASDTALPTPPEQFQSYWSSMTPKQRGCVLREMIRADLDSRADSFADATYDKNRLAAQMASTATRMLSHNGLGAGIRAGGAYIQVRQALIQEQKRHIDRFQGETPIDDNFALPTQRAIPGLSAVNDGVRVSERVTELKNHPFAQLNNAHNLKILRSSLYGRSSSTLREDIELVASDEQDRNRRWSVIADAMKLGLHPGQPSDLESTIHFVESNIFELVA